MKAPVHSVKFYLWVFAALLVLTALTTEAARFDLGPLNAPVAMLIAGAKAVIVALFFMHLKTSDYRSRVVAVAGLFWFVVLVAFVLADYGTRGIPRQAPGWDNTTEVLPRRSSEYEGMTNAGPE